jgi:syntaxin 7
MSFADFDKGGGGMAGPRRPPALISRKGVDEQLAQAKKLIQGITSQTAIMRNMVENQIGTASEDQTFRERLKFQMQEAYKMGNEASNYLKEIREVDPQNPEVAQWRSNLTVALASLRNVQTLSLQKEKQANAEAKMAIKRAKQDAAYDQNEVYSDEEGTEQEGLMEAHKRKQRQMLMQSEIATNEAIIAERETSIQDIESALVEIGKIMKDMSQEVQKQGENLETIEDHLENTLQSTRQATTEVKKAMKTQKKSRKKMCCLLFVVLSLIAAIVVYFSLVH